MSKINNNNIYMKYFLIPLFAVLLFGSCRKSNTATTPEAQEETQTTQITGEMAFEGVNSYCHSNYDWSIAEENPEIMYVAMGDESETEYKPGWLRLFPVLTSKTRSEPSICSTI